MRRRAGRLLGMCAASFLLAFLLFLLVLILTVCLTPGGLVYMVSRSLSGFRTAEQGVISP